MKNKGFLQLSTEAFQRLAVQAADIFLRVMNADQQRTSVRDRR